MEPEKINSKTITEGTTDTIGARSFSVKQSSLEVRDSAI